MRAHVSFLLAGLLVIATTEGQAADIVVKGGAGSGFARTMAGFIGSSPGPSAREPILREPPTIRLSGPLRPGDAEKMRAVLVRLKAQTKAAPDGTRPGPLATVELSSLGGDLNEGLNIGYLFRDFEVATVVRRTDICLSACALAFLGGTSRIEDGERSIDQRLEIGGKLGFHTFYLNASSALAPTAVDPVSSRQQGFREARGATAALVRYAADLGIDPKFVATMMAKPAEELTYINSTEEFLALKVCPAGLDRPAISLAEQALNVCNHATGWTDPSTIDEVRQLPPQQAKRYMLENIQENMVSLKVRGALSDQLASYSVMRVEKSIDNLYADLRAAGVRLPEIMGPVFEVTGYMQGGRPMQCFVSLSPDDPDKYAVAIRRPSKWSHPNHGAPRACRGLYLHHRDATINPRRPETPSPILTKAAAVAH